MIEVIQGPGESTLNCHGYNLVRGARCIARSPVLAVGKTRDGRSLDTGTAAKWSFITSDSYPTAIYLIVQKRHFFMNYS
jgi:hypothetical protein